MGVLNFTKTFRADNDKITLENLAGKRFAIDMMGEIWRAALGAKKVAALTDSEGKPTMHISVILSNLLEYKQFGISIICCFDHDDRGGNAEFHNTAKREEVAKRRQIRAAVNQQINQLRNAATTRTSKITLTDAEQTEITSSNATEAKIQQLEKRAFVVTKDMIDDIKFILNCLNIRHVDAPAGYEGEYMCVLLEKHGLVDGVMSCDTDPVPFGAKNFYKRNPAKGTKKTFSHYSQANILEQIDITGDRRPTIDDIRKICVLLGCDFAPKYKGLGPKTIIKKYRTAPLSELYVRAIGHFAQELAVVPPIINSDKQAFTGVPLPDLLNWLVEVKSFTRSRLIAKFEKAGLSVLVGQT
jgi:5'-3' exonuclease